jgi:subtilase family protein
VMAVFSSRGPTAITYGAKPDLVAPGVGTESLSVPSSTLYKNYPSALVPGTVASPSLPYLSLNGTSMAAPVVSGTVALMLQANPALTPNEIKAILQYTAQIYPAYDPLTEGAGFLNAAGAVALAQFLGGAKNAKYPSSTDWSARLIWGNQVLRGGRLTPSANAWTPGLTWGTALTPSGQNVQWGVLCSTAACDDTTKDAWRSTCLDSGCTAVNWGPDFHNAVWGTLCGGADCVEAWSPSLVAASDGDTVVWGTNADGDTVVWGTNADGDTVVWGTNADGDTVVWGTSCDDPACLSVVWSK